MRCFIEPKDNNGARPEEKSGMNNFLLCVSLRFWFIFLSFIASEPSVVHKPGYMVI